MERVLKKEEERQDRKKLSLHEVIKRLSLWSTQVLGGFEADMADKELFDWQVLIQRSEMGGGVAETWQEMEQSWKPTEGEKKGRRSCCSTTAGLD